MLQCQCHPKKKGREGIISLLSVEIKGDLFSFKTYSGSRCDFDLCLRSRWCNPGAELVKFQQFSLKSAFLKSPA